MWSKGFAALIALTALAILGAAIQNLVVFERSVPNIDIAGQLKRVEATETSTITAEELCRRPERKYLPMDVTLLAYNLRPDRGLLEGALRFHPVAKYRKAGKGLEKKVTPPGGFVFPQPSRIRVEITDTFGSHYETFSFPTSRLKVFTPSKPTRGVLRPVTFSVFSWSRMYPVDRYLLGVEVDIHLIDSNHRERRLRARTLSVDCKLGMGADLMDMVADAQVQTARNPAFILDLKRKTSTQAFVWLVALSPLIFALMVLHGLVFRLLTPQSFGIGTGLALLSIFSLRQVLVPQDLPGITLLDLVLGAEVAAMVMLAAAAYFVATRAARLSGSAEERVGPTTGNRTESSQDD
jgi:hypothetical protein